MHAPIRLGGLLRCTVNTIRSRTDPAPADGQTIGCDHCDQQAIYRDGAWEWHRTHAQED